MTKLISSVLVTDKAYPRGGSKPAKQKAKSLDAEFSIFKKFKSKKAVGKKASKKSDGSKSWQSTDKTKVAEKEHTVFDLSLDDIRPGICILGCVDRVTDLTVELALPGAFRAIVSAININSTFTGLIKNDSSQAPLLSDMFKIGEELPVVITGPIDGKKRKFHGSLNPAEVNSKLTRQHIQKQLIINAAVASLEDNGAVIDIGIANVTAFMLKKNFAPDHNYVKGEPIRVCLADEKAESRAFHVFDARVMNNEKEIARMPLHCLVPGIKWKLIVIERNINGFTVGMRGYDENVKAFIHRDYLKGVFEDETNYEVGTEMMGTLMYVLPVVNQPFFKMAHQEKPDWKIPYGFLVKSVEVVSSDNRGVFGKFKHGSEEPSKCFIPINKIDGKSENLEEKYPPGKLLPKMRIEWPCMMKRFYFGAIDQSSLSNELFKKSDLKTGRVLTCKILVMGPKYCTVSISPTLKGFVPNEHMSEGPIANAATKYHIGQKVEARVLHLPKGDDRAKLTLKPSLVKTVRTLREKTRPLPGEMYTGCVRIVQNTRILVEFFGGFIVPISRERLPVGYEENISSVYSVGQVVDCYVVSGRGTNLLLSLIYNENVKDIVKIGQACKAVVSNILPDGLYLNIEVGKKKTCPAFLPNALLSSHAGLAQQRKTMATVGSEMSVICVTCDPLKNPPCLLADHPVINRFLKKNKNALKHGENLITEDSVQPFVVLREPNVLSPVVPHDVTRLPTNNNGKFETFQVVMGRIQDVTSEEFSCKTSVSVVWDHNYMSSLEHLASFITECETLQSKLPVQSPLSGFTLGEVIKGKVSSSEGSASIITIKNKKKPVVKCLGLLKAEAKVTGRVIWVDYTEEVVWIQPFNDEETWPVKPEHRGHFRGRVIYSSKDVVVADSVGSHELVYIPTRRHLNDMMTCESAYKVGEATKLQAHRISGKLYGIDRKTALMNERKMFLSKDNEENPKRQKLSEPKAKKNIVEKDENECEVVGELIKPGTTLEQCQEVKQEVLSDEDQLPASAITTVNDNDSDAEIKSEYDSRDGMETLRTAFSDSEDDVEAEPVQKNLDVGFDWSVADKPQLWKGQEKEDSSSDEEEEVDLTENKKKKRLTGSEKREKARETEERLRAREAALVDTTRAPESADDFDRLVASTPDDSSIWLKFMAFHLENTEIEKARAVAKRALKIISFREEQEKLNIWLALINLEQHYGNEESQKEVMEEALRCNEPLKIHIHKLKALVDTSAGLEAEKLSNVLLKKYGDSETVWCEVGEAVMKLGKLDFARSILQRGMASLPNSKHVGLITRFAQLENKYGSSERAQTLYEHVLTAFPKRVDVWSAYVDLMVKSSRIDLARSILERSVSQSLPPKKMKVLFKKFLAFEESHGTAENVEKVREAAAEFIDNIVNA